MTWPGGAIFVKVPARPERANGEEYAPRDSKAKRTRITAKNVPNYVVTSQNRCFLLHVVRA